MHLLKSYPELQLIFVILNSDDHTKNIEQFLSVNKQINWEKFCSYSIKHGVAALLYKRLSDAGDIRFLPFIVSDLFKQQYYRTFAQNTVFSENLKNVSITAQKENIQVILLKGMALLENVYMDIGLRPMSDVDVLIAEKDATRFGNMLGTLNYVVYNETKSKLITKAGHFHLPPFIHIDNKAMIEVHTHIHSDDSPMKIDISEFLNNSLPHRSYGPNIGILSPADLLHHLCIHINEHLQTNEIRLSHFYDIAELIKKYNNNGLDWRKFIDDTVKFNSTQAVFPQLYLAHKYFLTDLPAQISERFDDFNKNYVDRNFLDILLLSPLNSKELADIKQQEIDSIKGFKNKLKFIAGDLFPSRQFMLRRYEIKYRGLLIFYYVNRWFIALNRLIFILFSRKGNS
jgi:hypothetical protein